MARVPVRVPKISYSFKKLQEIAASFDIVAQPGQDLAPVDKTMQRRLTSLVKAVGNASVPLLARKLCGGNDAEASWAFWLLSKLGGARVIGEVHRWLADAALADAKKAVLLALLAELGAPVPDEVVLKDADALAQASVRELLCSLKSPADYRQAAELIVAHVAGRELEHFLEDLVSEDPGANSEALRLLDALLAAPTLPDEAIRTVRKLSSGIRERDEAASPTIQLPPPPTSKLRCRVVVQKTGESRTRRPRKGGTRPGLDGTDGFDPSEQR